MYHTGSEGGRPKLLLEAPRKFCSVWISSSSRCPEVEHSSKNNKAKVQLILENQYVPQAGVNGMRFNS